jgi:site-specific DNA-cytosine methylase
MRYFSLFTGIGADSLAMQRVFPDATCVGYSEIDGKSLRIYQKHFPEHKNYGDVSKLKGGDLPPFDLIIAGSPCTGFSSMNADKKEWKDPRSALMFHFFRLLEECQPKYYVLENVASMTNEVKRTISNILGTEPVFINSNCFTAQFRTRYYWTNFPVETIAHDVNRIFLKDILDPKNDYKATNITIHGVPLYKALPPSKEPYALRHLQNHHYIARDDGKMGPVLTTYSTCSVIWDGKMFRQLSPIELERLQGFPDDWTNVSLKASERIKCIGNAFTVPVIVYLLENLKRMHNV